MKLKFIDENLELELKFTSLAVEKIEDEYNMTMDELFSTETKLKAKMVNFMLWSLSNTDLGQDEFKKILAKYYTYNECIEMLTESFKSPNGESPENAVTEKA